MIDILTQRRSTQRAERASKSPFNVFSSKNKKEGSWEQLSVLCTSTRELKPVMVRLLVISLIPRLFVRRALSKYEGEKCSRQREGDDEESDEIHRHLWIIKLSSMCCASRGEKRAKKTLTGGLNNYIYDSCCCVAVYLYMQYTTMLIIDCEKRAFEFINRKLLSHPRGKS